MKSPDLFEIWARFFYPDGDVRDWRGRRDFVSCLEFNDRLLEIYEDLEILGVGAFRRVVDRGDGTVVKIPVDVRGIFANLQELYMFREGDYFTPVPGVEVPRSFRIFQKWFDVLDQPLPLLEPQLELTKDGIPLVIMDKVEVLDSDEDHLAGILTGEESMLFSEVEWKLERRDLGKPYWVFLIDNCQVTTHKGEVVVYDYNYWQSYAMR